MEPSAAGKAPVRMAGRRSGMYKSEIDGRRNVVRKDEGKGWEWNGWQDRVWLHKRQGIGDS